MLNVANTRQGVKLSGHLGGKVQRLFFVHENGKNITELYIGCGSSETMVSSEVPKRKNSKAVGVSYRTDGGHRGKSVFGL